MWTNKTSSTHCAFSSTFDELAIVKAGLSSNDGQETAKPIQSCQGGYNQGLLIIPPPPPLVNILKTQHLHVTLCTLQIQLQFSSKDRSKTFLTSSCEGPEMPSALFSMVQAVLVEEERLADVVPHGLEGMEDRQ